MEDVTILRLGTDEAVKNIQDLRDNINKLRDDLKNNELTWEQQQAILKTLQLNQAALKNAMYGTEASLEEVTRAAAGANVVFDAQNKLVKDTGYSYNGLVKRMAELDQQFRATEDAGKRQTLGKQINEINNALKEMDADRGKFGRNVGNYKSALDGLASGFKATAGSAGAIINPLASITTGFKALSATPAVAILGLLANVLTKIIGNLKSSEENTNRMTKAMSAFAPMGDAVTKILQALGNAIAWVVEKTGDLLEKMGLLGEASKQRKAIAEDEIRLQEQQRETIVKNAEAQRDVAELRAKSADKEKYTAAERLQFLEEAGRREQEIAARAMEDARLAYEIQKAKNSLTASSAEEKRKEAEAYAALVAAETAYYSKQREYNSQMSAMRNEQRSNAAAAESARIAAERALVDQQIALTRKGTAEMLALREEARRLDYEKAVTDAKKNIKDTATRNKTLLLLEKAYQNDLAKLRREFAREQTEEELKAWENTMNGYEQGSELYLTMAVELRRKTYETLSRLDDESDAAWNARRIAALNNLQKAEQELLNAQIESGRIALENEMNALREGSVEQLAVAVDLARYELDNLHKQICESDDAFLARRLAAQKALTAAEEALLQGQTDAERLAIENRMNAYREGSIEYLTQAVELKKYELETLHQLESESNDEFRARQLEAEKAYADAQRNLIAKRVANAQTYLATLNSVFSAVADIYEADAEADEKAARNAKALRTAGAILSTLSGAVSAFTSTWSAAELPYTAKIILAPTNAAAVLAAGYAQIKQMNAVKVGNSAGAAVSAPAFSPAVSQVRNITGASEEERLNRMASNQRVYLVYSDLEIANTAQRVKVRETEF